MEIMFETAINTTSVTSNQLVYVTCNLCNQDDYQVVWKESGLNIVRCNHCGLMYVNPRSEKEAREDFFEESFFANNRLTEKEQFIWEIARKARHEYVLNILENMGLKGKLLDVGCGLGYFIKEARQRGWQVHGVDPSKRSCAYAAKQLGLPNVYQGYLDDAPFEEQYFDVITLWDILEHCTDPLKLLRITRNLLKPEGMVFIQVPNTSFHLLYNRIRKLLEGKKGEMYLMPSGHLYHFTLVTLGKILNKANFNKVHPFVGEPTRVMLIGKNSCNTVFVPLKLAYAKLARLVYKASNKGIYLSNSINVFATGWS